MVCGPGQLAIAALPAVQVNVTVTLELFQPLALGAGEAAALMVGGAAAVIVKFAELDQTPPWRTWATPVLEPEATLAMICVSLQLTTTP